MSSTFICRVQEHLNRPQDRQIAEDEIQVIVSDSDDEPNIKKQRRPHSLQDFDFEQHDPFSKDKDEEGTSQTATSLEEVIENLPTTTQARGVRPNPKTAV